MVPCLRQAFLRVPERPLNRWPRVQGAFRRTSKTGFRRPSREGAARRGRQEDRHGGQARPRGRGLHGRGRRSTATTGSGWPPRARYDLIVLDIMLPGRNGFQVCADLREAGIWTPILMLTAKDGDLDEAEALDTGADDYLTKPFSFPVLVARVRALLRRTAGARPAPVVVGDLRIDPGGRRGLARRHGGDASPRGSSTCSSSWCAGPARCCRRTRSSPACGTTTSTATRTSSRSTSAACAARSTSRSIAASIETVRGAGYRLDDDVMRGRRRCGARVTALATARRARRARRAPAGARAPAAPLLTETLDERWSSGRRAPQARGRRRCPRSITGLGDDDTVAQVVSTDGRVVAASATSTARRRVAGRDPRRRPDDPRPAIDCLDEDGRVPHPVPGVDAPDGAVSCILVAASLDDIDESVRHAAAGRCWWPSRSWRPCSPRSCCGGSSGARCARSRRSAPRWRRSAGRRLDRRVPVPASDDEIARLARTMNDMLDRVDDAGRAPAALRRRRLPRAAQPADPHAVRARGRPRPPRQRRSVGRPTAACSTRRSACSASSTTSCSWPATPPLIPMMPAATTVDLADVARRVGGRPSPRDNISVDVVVTGALPVVGNESELVRAVSNVLDNASRHARSTVRVVAMPNGESVNVAVEDDGPGDSSRPARAHLRALRPRRRESVGRRRRIRARPGDRPRHRRATQRHTRFRRVIHRRCSVRTDAPAPPVTRRRTATTSATWRSIPMKRPMGARPDRQRDARLARRQFRLRSGAW